MKPIEVLTDALTNGGYGPTPKGMARCPAHDDHTASMSFKAEGDTVLLHCHAGCQPENIIAALNLTWAELYPPRKSSNGKKPDNIIATYNYSTADGTLLYRVHRTADKRFLQQQANGQWNMAGVQRVLYRLPQLARSTGKIWITEGEKDADSLCAKGLTATTSSGGAGKWEMVDQTPLTGKDIIIWADNDTPGLNHAHHTATCLQGVANTIKIYTSNGAKDAAEYLETHPALRPDDFTEHPPNEPTEPDKYTPLDWNKLWAREQDVEWFAEPILPRERSVALYAKQKAGKSLLVLDIIAAVATGNPILTRPNHNPPEPVVYIDFEQGEADLLERLESLEYTPNQLTNLHYYMFPPLPPLDTEAGGKDILDIAEHHNAKLVVFDTASRIVEGGENDADTWRAFWKHTGMTLKREGIAFLRIDHAGKDSGQGQRGSSAKGDDVDIVWNLTVDAEDPNDLILKRHVSRVSWVPEKLAITRQDEPLRHTTEKNSYLHGAKGVADKLDALDAPVAISRRAAEKLLKEAHGSVGKTIILCSAIQYRKDRLVAGWPIEVVPSAEPT